MSLGLHSPFFNRSLEYFVLQNMITHVAFLMTPPSVDVHANASGFDWPGFSTRRSSNMSCSSAFLCVRRDLLMLRDGRVAYWTSQTPGFDLVVARNDVPRIDLGLGIVV